MLQADPRYLGAIPTEEGTNFSIWAEAADAVELCLFDEINGKMVEPLLNIHERLVHFDAKGSSGSRPFCR